MEKIRIATRESALALWQAEYVKDRLETTYPGITVEIIGMTTRGDQILDMPLSKIGGKGLFIKELESALMEKQADIAVHSMKDVPMEMPPGFTISSICARADPRDAFVSNQYASLASLPEGARLGTSSVRRRSQLAALRPDLEYVDLRGNVGTRLGKLDDGQYEAIILAVAGLQRLKLDDRITDKMSVQDSIPAAGQGAVGIECRSDDEETIRLVAALGHAPTSQCVTAERAMARALNANCEAPFAAYAQLNGDRLELNALVASLDGKQVMRETQSGHADEAEQLGTDVASALISRGALELLA